MERVQVGKEVSHVMEQANYRQQIISLLQDCVKYNQFDWCAEQVEAVAKVCELLNIDCPNTLKDVRRAGRILREARLNTLPYRTYR